VSRSDEVPTLADLGKLDPRACPVCQVVGAHKHAFESAEHGVHRKAPAPPASITHETGPTGLVVARGHGVYAGMSASWRGAGDPDHVFAGDCNDHFAREIAKYRAMWGV
jgi:hypothetical protein